MIFEIDNVDEDVGGGALLIRLSYRSQDDTLNAYYSDGELHVRLPLYAHEAQQLIEVLQPLADMKEA